jgi:hypothetical protein
MNTLVKSLVIAALGIGMALPAAADASFRQHKGQNLDNRIEQGVRSGELTRKEVRKLRRERREIRQMRRDFLSDGRLSTWERRTLARAKKRLSRHVYRLKHNDRRVRYGYRPWRQHPRSYPFFGLYYYDSNRDRRHHYRHDYSHDYRHDYRRDHRDHRRHR